MHYDNSPQGYAYQYDQLNRITKALAFQNLNSNNYWQKDVGVTERYRNNFTYDANGNIKTQVRNDAFDIPIDQLTYNYDTYLNGKLKSNKLYSVTDLVLDGVHSDDIDNQLANNYGYDKLGNLIHDTKEEIGNIEWTVTGKISKIIRTSGSTKANLEFRYDASGNRIQKIVKPSGSGNDETQWIKTNYVIDASGNAMALYEEKTVSLANQYLLKEKYIYGSSRLGTENSMVDMYAMASSSALNGIAHKMRFKQYELTNHLGNVLATISDQKIPSYSGTTINHYLPNG